MQSPNWTKAQSHSKRRCWINCKVRITFRVIGNILENLLVTGTGVTFTTELLERLQAYCLLENGKPYGASRYRRTVTA